MRLDSYADIVKTPEAHLAFLRHVSEVLETIPADQVDNIAGALYGALRNSVEVGGKPFSEARHLVALERASEDWDLDALSEVEWAEVVSRTARLVKADGGYALDRFVVGYELIGERAQEAGHNNGLVDGL